MAAEQATSNLHVQPPASIEAERVVLGSALSDPSLIPDLAAIIKGEDFYSPQHEVIWDAIIGLADDNKPVEVASLVTELRDKGNLTTIGGAPAIAAIVGAAAPASAHYYANVIKEKAGKRRLQLVHALGAQHSSDGTGKTLDDLIGEAQGALNEIAETGIKSDVIAVRDTINATIDRVEELGKNKGAVVGVPTGFHDLDEATSGLHPGQMIIIAARPAVGKALALDTPLPTPTGWTTMGEVKVGDYLLDRNGWPTRVVAATDVMSGRPCYEIEFHDGERIVADADHQWVTSSRSERRQQHRAEGIRTSREIAETLTVADARTNHSIHVHAGLKLPEVDLPIGPYTLGAWLGDGVAAGNGMSSATDEIPQYIAEEGYDVRHLGGYRYSILQSVIPRHAYVAARECTVCGTTFTPATIHVQTCGRVCGGRAGSPGKARLLAGCPECGAAYSGGRRCQSCAHANTFTGRLRTLGVLDNKHIPLAYMRASDDQRRALLAGLLDTDGTVTQSGTIEFGVSDKRLADDVYELIMTLGYRASRTTKSIAGRDEAHSTFYRITFTADTDVFRLEHKRKTHWERRNGRASVRAKQRFIVAARPVPSVPVRCVEVDNAEHLYLAGPGMTPTHNSTLGVDFLRHACVDKGLVGVLFSLEMSHDEINMRLLSAHAKVKLQRLRSGEMQEDDWDRVARKMGAIEAANLFIDDTAETTMSQVRAKARRLKQQMGRLDLIVIDYLQLMRGDGRFDSRQAEVSDISRKCKLLAKELHVPVIAMSQLNRGPEARADGRPKTSDLRESGSLEQDADMVLLLHREELFNPDTPRVGEADIIIAKQRSGPTKDIQVNFQGMYSRFVDAANFQ